ncbi:uncharacterized protein LOC112552883 [Pogonomyrmex barbatus]|uniref:Uncharacterized protein LOC112552883 n=1 Tax=Pogonomyrmex barbatus TaxID=144034 RepID=A0A8N1S7X6_9HYME|nr:uncharacterized protein LOC112552883 [Pogonomyrmex barbatus]
MEENAKVSDSGYSNTCSQSQRSSGSSNSNSRSNRSESSGYCGRRPSTFGSSNEALPQPISKKKDKEHRKKKSKTVTACNAAEAEVDPKTVNPLPEVASYNAVTPANVVLDKKPGWLRSAKNRERVHANGSRLLFHRTRDKSNIWDIRSHKLNERKSALSDHFLRLLLI